MAKETPTITGNAAGAPTWGTPTWSYAWAAATNSDGTATAPTTTSDGLVMQAIDVFVAGGDLKEEPYKTMNHFFGDNKKGIKEAGVENSVQYGAWYLAFDVTVGKNAATATWEKGWGYLPQPAMHWTDGTYEACVPINFGTQMGIGTGKTVKDARAADEALWSSACKDENSYDYMCDTTTACDGVAVKFLFDTVETDTTKLQDGTSTMPAVGDMHSYMSIWINNSANKYVPPAARGGMAVTTVPVIDCKPTVADTTGDSYSWKEGASAFAGQSWDSTWDTAAIGSDWSAPAAFPAEAPTWNKVNTCSSAWTSASDCDGITRWAFNSAQTAPTASATGHWTGYHWLADKKPSDATKVFQIEDGATLQFIYAEHWGNTSPVLQTWDGTIWSSSWDYTCTHSTFYAVGSMTYTMGASGLVGMTAATLAAFAALF